jgi:hypothetical protein
LLEFSIICERAWFDRIIEKALFATHYAPGLSKYANCQTLQFAFASFYGFGMPGAWCIAKLAFSMMRSNQDHSQIIELKQDGIPQVRFRTLPIDQHPRDAFCKENHIPPF